MRITKLHFKKTLRFRILFPIMIITALVTMLEIVYLNRYAFNIVEDIVLDTKNKNVTQVLNSVERYFDNIELIAQKPLNTAEISSSLRKDYPNLPISEKTSAEYAIQSFLFREIMLQNPDIESTLIYDTSEDDFYGISDTYLLYKNSYYDFNNHKSDILYLQNSEKNYLITDIRKSNMLVQPHEEYVVTYVTGFNNSFDTDLSLYGAFFINIKASAFHELCSKNFTEDSGSYFLLDQNNNIVACSSESLTGTNINDHYPISQILESDNSATYNDKDYLYTVTEMSPTTGWRVVSISETASVFGYKNTIFCMVLLSMFVLVLTISFTVFLVISNFTKTISVMKEKLLQVTAGNLQVNFESTPDEIGEVNEMIQGMLNEINQLISRIYVEENAKRELQLHSLQNQITPHFIYNTLSRIKWMATMQQANSLADSIGSFSDILAYCMKSTDYFVKLEEAISFLDSYIKIMNLKMLDEVHAVFNIPKHLYDIQILRFLLQPIIENVFFHAFTDVQHECILEITAEEQNTDITFYIKDNGIGMSPEQIRSLFTITELPSNTTNDSIALKNIQQRIKYHYGDNYDLTVLSQPDRGTTVIVKIPLIRTIPTA